ncbi:MAG TPA: AMIN domain-containing protein, partial [Thermodesulfobacteriota bacterium]|nr:AMIN domain-containing protein [Thermodesulfobacteriota bacterium]
MKRSQILITTFGLFLLFLITRCATENASVRTPKPDTSAPVTKVSTIQKITFVEEENYTKIQIEGSEPIASPFYKLLSDPLRIAIDVPDIDLRQIKSPLKIDNGTIGEIVTTQYDDKGRIEISLLQMTNYNISKEEKNLIIDVEKVKKVEEAKEAKDVKEVKKEEEALKETKVEAPAAVTKKEEPLPTPPPMNKAKKVVNVTFEEKKDFITFNILADGKIGNFDTFKLDSPPRLVLDVWGVDTRKSSFKVKNPLIKAVRIGHYPDKLRLVFDSQKLQLPPYQVNRIDDKLMVSLGNIPQPSEPQIFVQGKSAKEPPAGPSKAQAESPGKPNTLTGIDFKRMDDKSRVILSLSEENPQFESSTPSKNVIAIEVKNASAPKNLLKGLDTSSFKSVVSHVELKNVKVGKTNDVQVLVKLGEEAPYETTKEGKEIFIDVKEKPKKIEAKAEAQPQEVKKEEVIEPKKEEAKKEEVKKEEEVSKEVKPTPESKKQEVKAEEKPVPQSPVAKKVEEVKKVSDERAPQKAYTGTKLSLDFKDADIKNILRLIAEVSNLNIIVADEVTGKITMRLVDVPWDQALDIILESKNLGKRQVGNVVRIAPAEVLRREDQAKLEEQRSKDKLEPLLHELIPVNYATAKEIMPQVKSILSERGDVKVDDRTNTLIVKDISRTLPDVKNLVKALDTKTPMVLIEARIVEANLTFQSELGVQWGFLVGGAKAKMGGGGVGTAAPTTQALGTTVNEVLNLGAVPRTSLQSSPTTAAGLLSAVFSRGTIQELDVTLSAHEFKGDVKI